MRNKLVMILGLIAINSYADFYNISNNAIKTSISNRDFNRISIKDDKINQVFYKHSEFLIKLDEPNGQLFFMPRNKSSKYPLSLTVTSSKKVTQHLFFLVKNIGSQAIILKKPAKSIIVQKQSLEEGAKKLINQLISQEIKLDKKVKKILVKKGWKLKQLGQVKLGSRITGKVLVMKNVSKSTQNLTSQMLWKCNTQALSIDKQTLKPGQSTKVYIVTKEAGI